MGHCIIAVPHLLVTALYSFSIVFRIDQALTFRPINSINTSILEHSVIRISSLLAKRIFPSSTR